MSEDNTQPNKANKMPAHYYDKREAYFQAKMKENWDAMLARMRTFLKVKSKEKRNPNIMKSWDNCFACYQELKDAYVWEPLYATFIHFGYEKDFFKIGALYGFKDTNAIRNELVLITQGAEITLEDSIVKLQAEKFTLNTFVRLIEETEEERCEREAAGRSRLYKAEFRDLTSPTGLRVVEFARASDGLPKDGDAYKELAENKVVGGCHRYSFFYAFNDGFELHTGFDQLCFRGVERAHSWVELDTKLGKRLVLDLTRNLIIGKQDYVDLFGVIHETEFKLDHDAINNVQDKEERMDKYHDARGKFSKFVLSYGYKRDIKNNPALAKSIAAFAYRPDENAGESAESDMEKK